MSKYEIFEEPWKIGKHYPKFTRLAQLGRFAEEAASFIWKKEFFPDIEDDIERCIKDIKGEFIGTVIVNEALLLKDEEAVHDLKSETPRLLGPMFGLDLSFKPTGYPAIDGKAGLVIGENPQDDFRIQVRAYDLRSGTFGSIHNSKLEKYLDSSKKKGGTSGGSGKRKPSSSQNLGSFD